MTVRLYSPEAPAPFTWGPEGEGDCPHVLDVLANRIRYYCTGNLDHPGDHAAEGNAGTVATWATGDPGDDVDDEAAQIIARLGAAVDEAMGTITEPEARRLLGIPRTRRLRRKGRK